MNNPMTLLKVDHREVKRLLTAISVPLRISSDKAETDRDLGTSSS